MKKILFLNPGPIYHYASTSYQDRYTGLSRYFEGYILTTADKKAHLSIGGFEFSAIPSASGFIGLFKFFFFCITFVWRLKQGKNKIDAIVTYDPIKTGFIGWLASRILCCKLIIEVNGVYTSESEWLEIENPFIRYLKKKIVFGLIRFNLKHADGIKLLFDSQVAPFHSSIPDKLIAIYPEYVPISLFKPLKEKKEVLFAGFPFKRKGVDVLIRAFKNVAPNYPDWELRILGWYPDPEELYAAISGHPQIIHEKPVNHDKMPEYIGSCAFLVLPSRSEAMGRVLIEAMAAGKPRIGSNVDGIPTVIDDGVDGFLVEPENVKELTEKMALLMGNTGERKSLGDAARKRAGSQFTVDIYVANCHTFYTEALNP